ncbi:Hypothetical predicted protein, partial [Marmota monax]
MTSRREEYRGHYPVVISEVLSVRPNGVGATGNLTSGKFSTTAEEVSNENRTLALAERSSRPGVQFTPSRKAASARHSSPAGNSNSSWQQQRRRKDHRASRVNSEASRPKGKQITRGSTA